MLSNASNIVVVCSHSNGMFESSEAASKAAQRYGWKLRPGQDPLTTPVFDAYDGIWYYLDDNYGKREVPQLKSQGDYEPKGQSNSSMEHPPKGTLLLW